MCMCMCVCVCVCVCVQVECTLVGMGVVRAVLAARSRARRLSLGALGIGLAKRGERQPRHNQIRCVKNLFAQLMALNSDESASGPPSSL